MDAAAVDAAAVDAALAVGSLVVLIPALLSNQVLTSVKVLLLRCNAELFYVVRRKPDYPDGKKQPITAERATP